MDTTLVSIQIGQPKTYSDEKGTWETAFYKEPVNGPISLTTNGLVGDGVANTEHHGGQDQAVMLYSADHYPRWQTELRQEFPFVGFAENLTISGMDENTVCIDDVYQIGPVKLQVTKPRIPCWKIARRWDIPDLTKRATQSDRTGWYCRVLKAGEIEPGLPIELLERGDPGKTVAQAFHEYLQLKKKS